MKHNLYHALSALKDFQSPTFSCRRADFADLTRYMSQSAPDATKADEPGRVTVQDGTVAGDDAYKQRARQRVPIFSGSEVTCRCLWKRDRQEDQEPPRLAPAAASSRPMPRSLQTGSPWSSGRDPTGKPPRQGRRIQTGTKRRLRILIPRCRDECRTGSMSSCHGPARNTASHPWRARDVRLSCRSPAPRSPCCVPISARR